MSVEFGKKLKELEKSWRLPQIPEEIPHGDMPGDQVVIGEGHIRKAELIFPKLLGLAGDILSGRTQDKIVIAVSGGSGVGKSETASLLSWFFAQAGIGSYTLSGDNYPRRIPAQNDAERQRVFRVGGIRGMLAEKVYCEAAAKELAGLWEQDTDAEGKLCEKYPWLAVYQKYGREALAGYLGTEKEQDFDELSDIIRSFLDGAGKIFLKRMGRTPDALWYDEVDFSNVQVLVIEWTHGNSAFLKGIDIPVLLNSTPEETREHRRARNRDGKTDSPFTTMVLEIEQGKLDARAEAAKLIVSKSCELLSFEEYCRLMR